MGAVAYIQPAIEAGIYRELTVSEVDRISHALGKLVAEAEESKRQRSVLYDKIDRLEREHGEIASLLRQHVEEQVRHEDDIRKTYEHLIEPTLRDYRAVKNPVAVVEVEWEPRAASGRPPNSQIA